MPRPLRIAAAAAVALAALSLLLPYQPVYDPWGWLVWGRELAHLDLATGAGPSWKPLPVFINAPLSLLGEAGPEAWLLVARTGWLLAPALAAWLVVRLAGSEAGRWRYAGAALAAASVALTGDAFTPPTRQFTGGLSEPMGVALVLGAAALALQRRPGGALWLGVAASLLRPECWPFLVAWAIWEMRRNPRLRPHAIAAAILIPLAWFVPDLIGAGNPLEGSETARNGGLELSEIAEVLGRALIAPLAAIWIGVALFLAPQTSGATHLRPISPSLRFTGVGRELVGAMRWFGCCWRGLWPGLRWSRLWPWWALRGFPDFSLRPRPSLPFWEGSASLGRAPRGGPSPGPRSSPSPSAPAVLPFAPRRCLETSKRSIAKRTRLTRSSARSIGSGPIASSPAATAPASPNCWSRRRSPGSWTCRSARCRLCGDDRLGHGWCCRRPKVRLLVWLFPLVVCAVRVDGPDVVICAVAEVFDRAHRGQHRVI